MDNIGKKYWSSWLTVNNCRHASILIDISLVFYNGIYLTEYSHKWWFCSNDDPIFGHVSLENSDELWSSKDVSNIPVPVPLDAPSPAGALRNRSEPFEVKEKHVQCNDQSFSHSYEKIGGPASQVMQNSYTTTANEECAGVRSKPTGKEQQVCQVNFHNHHSLLFSSLLV